MIHSLKIRNFQCHENLLIKFDSRVTCILGHSDVGKSAILRAFRWVCFNKPSGTQFISHGTDTAFVEATFDDNKVRRVRGPKENSYFLNGSEYKAFRDDVPEDIQTKLNLNPDLNFQGQLDPPFWLLKSPGEVSRELNQIVNLERIDRVLSKTSIELRRAKMELDVTEQRKHVAETTIQSLQWVKEANEEYQLLQKRQAKLDDEKNKIHHNEQLIEEAWRLAYQESTLGGAYNTALLLSEITKELQKRINKVTIWEELITTVERLWQECEELKNSLDREQELLKQETGGLCPVCESPLQF